MPKVLLSVSAEKFFKLKGPKMLYSDYEKLFGDPMNCRCAL